MTASRRTDLGIAACLALLPMLVFPDVVFAGFGFFQRDIQRFAIPNASVFREIVLSGEFPGWNPLVSGGQPLAANPNYGVFYPPSSLVLLPDFHLMFQLVLLLHLSLALVGTFGFLRSIGLQRAASVFGAVSFGLSGLLLSYLNVTNLLFAVAWVPLILLFGVRAIRQPTIRDTALASLFLGMQVIVGEPTTLLQTVSALIAFGVYDTVSSRRRLGESTRRAGVTAAILLGAFCLGAVQLLPALDLLRDTERARGLQFEMVSAWSMPPARPLELLFPEIFGRRQEGGLLYWAGGNYDPPSAPYVFDLYLGLAAALLVVAAILRRIRGAVPLAVVFVASYVLAIGDHTPLLRWLYDDGLLRSIRYPEKFILAGLVALIVLASLALDRALAGDERLVRSFVLAAMIVALVCGVAVLVTLLPGYPWLFAAMWDIPDATRASRLAALSRIDWLHAVIRSSAVLALGIALLRQRANRVWYAAGLAFLLFDLRLAAGRAPERMPEEFFDPPAIAADAARAAAGGRLVHLPSIADAVFRERLPVAGNARYWAAREALFPRIAAASGIATVYDGDYDLANLRPSRDLFAAFVANWTLRRGGPSDFFYAIAGAGAVLDRVPGSGIRIVPRRSARFYFADRIVATSGVEDFVRQTLSSQWSERTAFIEGKPFVPASGEVLSARQTASSATISVRSAGRALLVLSVTPHRYWRIRIDGRPVKPLVVNLGFQGVVVDRGAHIVEMNYHNPLTRWGAAVSGATLVVILCALLSGRLKQLVRAPATDGA